MSCLINANKLPLQQISFYTVKFMKKLYSILLLAFICIGAFADNSSVKIGYCNGVVNKSSTIGATGKNWVDAAIYLPSNLIQAYSSNSISSIDVGLASTVNVDTVKVWVRTSLTGENLAEGEIVRGNIIRGWNDIELTNPYKITGEENGLYIGYSFKQRGSVNAISFVPTATQDAFWTKLGSKEEWQDLSSQGALSLEATISGDNIYKYDIGISNQTAQNISNTNSISVTATFKNYGTEDVNSIELIIGSKDGTFKTSKKIDADIKVGYSVEKTFTVDNMPIEATLTDDFYIAADKINGEEDQNHANDNVDLIFAHERKVVIEEFTSEGCVNCPRMARMVKNVTSKENLLGKTIVVCHHDGFSTDFLSRPEDSEYLWFFNVSTTSTYAPAIMLDRYPYFKNKESKVTPVFDCDDTELEAGIKDRLAVPTYTKLNIEAKYENQEKLKVTVNGFRAKPFCNTPARITLYLIEDSIKARNQVGADDGFMHMHVKRVINNTWGEVIEWNNDGSFTYNYDMNIADYWNKKHLSVVAFISSYDENDVANCVIENAEQLSIKDLSTNGISESMPSAVVETEKTIFTIDGRRIKSSEAHGGLFIAKTKFNDGSVMTKKEYIE